MNDRTTRQDENQAPDTPQKGFFEKLDIEFLVHELKDPISIIETGIRTLLERREKYGPITERQEKTLRRVLRNTRKTREMLYDLLEVGRSEAGFCISCRFGPVRATRQALMDALDTVCGDVPDRFRDGVDEGEMIAFLSDLGIHFHVAPEAMELEMLQDETKFRQIVGNLIKNALHHRKERVDIFVAAEGARIAVDVTDDGPGVDPKHRELVFERYAQVNECTLLERKGHGLGLAGALALARCLGGDIGIDSDTGRGATFRLTLPVTYSGKD
jgi:two-component system, OmpR family, sensor kinase